MIAPRPLVLAAALCGVLFPGGSRARADLVTDLANCTKLKEADKRLACFDKAVAASPSVAVAKRPPSTDARSPALAKPMEAPPASGREVYRADLERAFLSNGVNANVFLLEKTSTLQLWLLLDRASVFKLITEGNILEKAKTLGFKKVDFWDKGDEGHWIFDLSKPGPPPQCDVMHRLCL